MRVGGLGKSVPGWLDLFLHTCFVHLGIRIIKAFVPG